MKKSVKKSVKKKSSRKVAKGSRSSSRSLLAASNLDVLVDEGVIVEPDRLTDDEKEVIDSLSPEEVAALISMRDKFESHTGASQSPFWRAFVF